MCSGIALGPDFFGGRSCRCRCPCTVRGNARRGCRRRGTRRCRSRPGDAGDGDAEPSRYCFCRRPRGYVTGPDSGTYFWCPAPAERHSMTVSSSAGSPVSTTAWAIPSANSRAFSRSGSSDLLAPGSDVEVRLAGGPGFDLGSQASSHHVRDAEVVLVAFEVDQTNSRVRGWWDRRTRSALACPCPGRGSMHWNFNALVAADEPAFL